MVEYDVSDDGKEVVFSAQPDGKVSQLWLARQNGSAPARMIASSGECLPHFGREDQVLFQLPEGKRHYVARMKKDGSSRSVVSPYPVSGIQTVSADRRWVVAIMPTPDGSTTSTMAIPVDGGAPRRICAGYCPASWSPDAKFLYVGVEGSSRIERGKTLAVPLPAGEMLPRLPVSGICGMEDLPELPGARVIDAWDIIPGLNPVFAYVKTTVHRNLFRIPVAPR